METIERLPEIAKYLLTLKYTEPTNQAIRMFAQGMSLEEVRKAMGAVQETMEYLLTLNPGLQETALHILTHGTSPEEMKEYIEF